MGAWRERGGKGRVGAVAAGALACCLGLSLWLVARRGDRALRSLAGVRVQGGGDERLG